MKGRETNEVAMQMYMQAGREITHTTKEEKWQYLGWYVCRYHI